MPSCGRCATPILCPAVEAGRLRCLRVRGCIMSMSAAALVQPRSAEEEEEEEEEGGGGGGPSRPMCLRLVVGNG